MQTREKSLREENLPEGMSLLHYIQNRDKDFQTEEDIVETIPEVETMKENLEIHIPTVEDHNREKVVLGMEDIPETLVVTAEAKATVDGIGVRVEKEIEAEKGDKTMTTSKNTETETTTEHTKT